MNLQGRVCKNLFSSFLLDVKKDFHDTAPLLFFTICSITKDDFYIPNKDLATQMAYCLK